jgi:superfamily I DNA/RNA helicase
MYPLCERLMCYCCSLLAQLIAVYRELLRAGIPADLQTGSFFDAIEVRTALALLLAVADPERAGEALEQRIIQANSDVKVPLTAGLGKWRAVQAGTQAEPGRFAVTALCVACISYCLVAWHLGLRPHCA